MDAEPCLPLWPPNPAKLDTRCKNAGLKMVKAIEHPGSRKDAFSAYLHIFVLFLDIVGTVQSLYCVGFSRVPSAHSTGH